MPIYPTFNEGPATAAFYISLLLMIVFGILTGYFMVKLEEKTKNGWYITGAILSGILFGISTISGLLNS